MVAQSVSGSTALGTPTQRYEGTSGAGGIVGALLFAGIGVFLLVVAAMGMGGSGSRSSGGSGFAFGFMGLIMLAFALYALFNWWRTRSLYVQLYSDGLARVRGSSAQEMKWDDIVAVWQSVTHYQRYGRVVRSVYVYTIQTNDKRTLKLSNEISNIANLGQRIQEEVMKRLYPRMVTAYEAGQPVNFGAFSLSKDGVSHKNKSLSWSEIEGAQINQGFVTFKKQGKWFNWANVPVAQIPNLFAFLSLVDHGVGLKRGR